MKVLDKNSNFSNDVEQKEKVNLEGLDKIKETLDATEKEFNEIEKSQTEAKQKASRNNKIEYKPVPETDSFDNKKAAFERYKDIDWTKISPKKILAVNAEIMIENKRLIQEGMQHKRYIEELENTNAKVTKKMKELDGILDYIASQLFCCNNIMIRVNRGEKISLNEKADLIIKSVLENETILLNNNQRYVEKIKEYKTILNNLQSQLFDLTTKRNEEIIDSEQTYKEEDIAKMINLVPEANDIIITATPLATAKGVFRGEVALAIAEAIGKKGISEFPEICAFCAKQMGFNDQKVEDVVFAMEKEKIINNILIKPFNRNRGVRIIEFTPEIGVKLFKDYFKMDPVESEMARMMRENDNYYHGYSIKDTYMQLLANGYKEEETSMDRKKNTITVSNSHMWVPDIVAKNPISKKVEYYEIETGKCNKQDLERKLEKAVLVTNKLKIIVPSKIIADSYLEYVKNWYNSKKTAPAITIIILSFLEFKNKDKTALRCYPKVLKEDVNISNEILKDIKNNQKNQKKAGV